MKTFLYALIFLIPSPVFSGIKKGHQSSWQLISGSFYIDTNDFQVTDNKINFWVKSNFYKKRRATIDCMNLIERESFNSIFTEWQPVLKRTPKYEIAKQLCFLSKTKGFTMEKKRNQPYWAKRIIKNSSMNLPKVSKNENKSLMKIIDKESSPTKKLNKVKKTQYIFE